MGICSESRLSVRSLGRGAVEVWKTLSTLVCMRRRILKRLLLKCQHVQIRNLRCSQSRCHPLQGETIQISCSILIQKADINRFLPELSSLTSDDIVLVMESAAMRRSFLRFLRGPFKTQRQKNKFLHQHLDTSVTVGVTVIP